MKPLLRPCTLLADKRGTASIEFAFVAPVLMLMYFGVAELSLAMEAKRKVTTTASTIGDLVAQTESINAAEVDAIFEAANAIMQPLDDEPMEIRLTSVRMEMNGAVRVRWSRARNTTPYGCGASLTPPAGVLTPGQSAILAEVAYDYEPPVGEVLTGTIRFQDFFYFRPRRSLEVRFNPPQCP